jgi:ERCC4-type nuclease
MTGEFGVLDDDGDADELDDAEAIRRAYVDGNISEAGMERRLVLALDEDRQELRRRVEEVPGVGLDTSTALANEFRSLTELAQVDQEEIADRVHGVGQSSAEAIQVVIRGKTTP